MKPYKNLSKKEYNKAVLKYLKDNKGLFNKFINKLSNKGIEKEDLEQEIAFLVFQYLKKFDNKRNVNINTYVAKCVYLELIKYVQQNRYIIRIPPHLQYGKGLEKSRDYIDLISSIKRFGECETELDTWYFMADDSNSIKVRADIDKANKIVNSIIDTIASQRQREVVRARLTVYNRRIVTFRDIADKLGISSQSVYEHYRAGIKHFKQILENKYNLTIKELLEYYD